MFLIYNRRTGQIVGKAKTLKAARRAVDRHDNIYGGYIHSIRTV